MSCRLLLVIYVAMHPVQRWDISTDTQTDRWIGKLPENVSAGARRMMCINNVMECGVTVSLFLSKHLLNFGVGGFTVTSERI